MDTPKVGPKDFFLWAGAMAAFYGSTIALITLLFEYIEYLYPDSLEYYVDPFSGGIRFAMASLIVLMPVTLFLMRAIRNDIARAAHKADLCVRRWALVLTVFVAGIMVVGDLIALINTFLGGDLTTRFILKVVVVLAVAGMAFFHFLLDLRGYWMIHQKRARTVGFGAAGLVLASIVAGFFIIGTPGEVRLLRFDSQKVQHLQEIQWQVVQYWQQKQILPATLEDMRDSLGGSTIPVDPQSGESYGYAVTGDKKFQLCATFNNEDANTSAMGAVIIREEAPRVKNVVDDTWGHVAGDVCFDRTIDPERYPPFKQ